MTNSACLGDRIGVTTLLILFIVFLATLIRSAFGFGEALVAIPLLFSREIRIPPINP